MRVMRKQLTFVVHSELPDDIFRIMCHLLNDTLDLFSLLHVLIFTQFPGIFIWLLVQFFPYNCLNLRKDQEKRMLQRRYGASAWIIYVVEPNNLTPFELER